MSKTLAISVAIVLTALAGTGCAPEIVRTPTAFTPVSGSKEFIQLNRSTVVPNWSGTGNTLLVGTRWAYIGELAQGRVYRSKDSVFFLQGANSHEAYLVIKDRTLHGFYLPGERAWSPLNPPLDIDYRIQ